VQEETWVGDSLTFRISALGQAASGVIDVREDHVLMEVQLPWLLHQIAQKAQGLIRKRGQLLLDKKIIKKKRRSVNTPRRKFFNPGLIPV
jgi:hypothetical protein